MASKKPLFLTIVVILWISCNAQLSSSSNSTASTTSVLIPLNSSIHVSTPALTVTPSLSSTTLQNSSKLNGSQSTISSSVVNVTSSDLYATAVSKTVSTLHTINGSSSTDSKTTLNATTTASTNYTMSSSENASLTILQTSTSTISSSNTAGLPYQTVSMSQSHNPTSSLEAAYVTSAVTAKVNSTLATRPSNSSAYYLQMTTSDVNATRSSTLYVSSFITHSTSQVFNYTTSSSSLARTLTVIATQGSVSTLSVNDSLNVEPTISLSSHDYQSLLISKGIEVSTTNGVSSTVYGVEDFTVSVEDSSRTLLMTSYHNMTTSSTSLLQSQSHRNVSGETIKTSVVDMEPSPMATTRALPSTAESIQTSSQVQTVGPSVSPSATSVSLLPSPTSTVNVTLETSSQTDDDIIVMSYTTPCYITYVITQTLNETRAQSTTVAMVTSSRNTTASSTEDRTVPSTFNVSKSQRTTMTPMVALTTSKVLIVETVTSSNTSVVMETPSVSLSSSSISLPVASTSRDVVRGSFSVVATNSSGIMEATAAQMTISHNMSILPTPATPSWDYSTTSSREASNNGVAMTTTTASSAIMSSNSSSSAEPAHTTGVNNNTVTSVLKHSRNATPSATMPYKSLDITSSVATELNKMMNNTSSVSKTMTTSPQTSSASSPNVTATSNYIPVSPSAVQGNNNGTSVASVSTTQILSTHDPVNNASISTPILLSGTTASPLSSSFSLSLTPALPNTTSIGGVLLNSVNTTTVTQDIKLLTSSLSSAFNSTLSISTTSSGSGRRRRRRNAEPDSSNSAVNTSDTSLVMSSTINTTGNNAISAVPASPTVASSSLPSSLLSPPNRTTAMTSHTLTTATNTTAVHEVVPTVTLVNVSSNVTSMTGPGMTFTVNMATPSPTPSGSPTPTTSSASLLNSSASVALVMDVSSLSTQSRNDSATSNNKVAIPTASTNVTLSTAAIFSNSTSSVYATPQTSSVTGASSLNATNNLPSTAALVSSTHGSSTMIQAANSSSISPGISNTPSIATRPSINESSTAPPVAVPMTTATVTMTTSITNTSNLNDTRVLQTSSTGISPMVSLSLVSRSLNVTATTSSDIGFNQSHVANSTTTHSTSFTTFTQTLIHPTPKLTSLTPSQTTSDVTSGVDSSSSRKNILLTTSSLGICYVVYTTRIMLSSSVPSSSSVTALNQTTAYKMSTVNLVNTSYMTVSSTAPSMSLVEMNSTIQQTTSSLSINITSSSVSIQEPSSSVQVNATPALNSTQTSSSVSKSVGINTTSVSPIATSMPSVVSMATSNRTMYPSTPSSSVVEVVQSSEVINSSSLFVYFSSTSSLYSTSSPTSSTLISPSTTSVVMTTSSVVTTTLPPPTTLPAPDLSLLIKTTLEIPRDIDENSAELRRNISKGLEEAFNTANNVRRRRRATEGTEAKIYNITRKLSPPTDVEVLFTISRNGNPLSANDAVNVYNKTVYLLAIGVWKVIRRPEEFLPPTPPPLVSMIFETIVRNLSVPSNKKALEDRLASCYKSKANTTARVTAKIYVVLLEKTGHVYVQFYVTKDGRQVPAATVVRVFEVDHVQQLTACLREQVIVGPYTDESLRGRETDYVQTRISLPPSTNMQDPDFHTELGDKLARAYISGKAKGSSRRKRRAVGSVSASIVNSTAVNGSSSFADVKFFIFDSGKVANATYAAAVLNRLTINEMSIITSPYAVITKPRPVVVPIVTETPPATIPPVVVPYWIIGAVLGPIFLIIIIILLIYWRWKTGAPQSKVQPAGQKTSDYLRKTKLQPMQARDEVRYSEGKPHVSKITNMSVDTERSYENLPRRETSLRRKVPKTTLQKRTDMSRTNAAYEESEEDYDYDNSFITMSSTSQSRIVTTQPGPGMKGTRTHSLPVRSTPRKTPKKIREEKEQREEKDEEEETESGSSESEPESIATARTDQTKFSAAQVPTVAVMGGSSGNHPQVPVRFRSSVHPVSSLPPIHNKQTSLVGVNVEPPTDDQEEITPRKSKRRSKTAQQELKQKADLERLRNKKRQRERKNKVTPVQNSDRRAWARDELEQVLDPKPVDPFSRNKRRKPHRSKRADSVATDEDAIELKSYRRHTSPEDAMKQPQKDEDQTEDQSGESSDDSSISMEETRKRMHTLLDDAFSLLGPLSQKQKQKNRTLEGPGDYSYRPPAPARYAGSRPALPEPAPAHGRATEPTPRQRRRLGNTGRFPHALPQTPIGPGYPVRPPVRPPLVTSDPVVVWDPYDRQRYINQRMGFQPQGGPNPTYTFTDPQGQNVYITPVQQQRDYLGGPIWSPYTAEDTMEDLYPDLAKSDYPGSLGTSPPKDPSYRDVSSRDTVIDMNDQYGQRGPGLGQAPQPLIRSIKDELLRLSNGGARRTPITEL